MTSGVKEVRELLSWARDEVATGQSRPVLFIDEIHRFNRSQQDALLPDVEEGIISLVGATTSNPYFAVNGALLSRSQIFEFQPLSSEDIRGLLMRAIQDPQRGFGQTDIRIDDEALDFLCDIVEGDARRALSALELAVTSTLTRPVHLTLELARESIQKKTIQFDATGDQHYDLASALIKSVRGSDVDAALYWLARAIESGEDIRFLCRRIVILASEDIGLADPQALSMSVSAMQACEFLGMPECQFALAQAVIYLALAPKSNSATRAIGNARKEVRDGKLIPVPRHLQDSHYAGAKDLGHGEGYQYAHDAHGGVAQQDYLGVDRTFYEPTDRGAEAQLAERYRQLRQLLDG